MGKKFSLFCKKCLTPDPGQGIMITSTKGEQKMIERMNLDQLVALIAAEKADAKAAKRAKKEAKKSRA